MMTKTTLSDGRRTRPRFAAPTPTPPKFLIGTIEQSENHSTPSKQTTNPNPNGHKSRFSRPPQRLADSRISIPRPSSGLIPFAQLYPRKLSGLSQSLGFTPLAQLHPRKAVTPLPAFFSYRWPPAGVFEVLATSRSLLGLVPLVQPYPRKPLVSGVLQRNGGAPYASLPFALVHPRNEQSARARSAAPPKTPAGARRYENRPLACPGSPEAQAPLDDFFLVTRHAPLITEILIANLELEFRLCHSRLSLLKISNRKYFAIFYSDLLLSREKSGRPKTSDRAIVATGIRAGSCSGFSRISAHRLRIASCGRPSLCGVAEGAAGIRTQSTRSYRVRAC